MATKLSDYRPFGRTGVKISPLTLGCMMFGRRTELEDSVRIIDRAIDAGINILRQTLGSDASFTKSSEATCQGIAPAPSVTPVHNTQIAGH